MALPCEGSHDVFTSLNHEVSHLTMIAVQLNMNVSTEPYIIVRAVSSLQVPNAMLVV